MPKEITWAPIIPLIGGFPIGAMNAIGKPPSAVMSYPAFAKSDGMYTGWLEETGHNVPFIDLEASPELAHKVNIVVATPPCAALSTLNSGTNSKLKGAESEKNDWMYKSLSDGISLAEADVIIIENAPALYAEKGWTVLSRLRNIAEGAGYSTSAYRTSTMYHGLPQNRVRTFFFAWKSETAPVLEFIRRPTPTLPDFLKTVDNSLPGGDIPIFKKLTDDGWWRFMVHKIGVETAHKMLNHRSAHGWVRTSGLMDEYIDWIEVNGIGRQHELAVHAKNQYAKGKGIWDGSPITFHDQMGAFTSKTFVTMHPTELRSLTLRESMALMGMPDSFVWHRGLSDIRRLSQNVPTSTAATMVEQAVKFINGELPFSGNKHSRVNNILQRIETDETVTRSIKKPANDTNQLSLFSFFGDDKSVCEIQQEYEDNDNE